MQRFRVECNFGCRYFKDIVKEKKYFKKGGDNNWDGELGEVSYLYCPLLKNFSARQDFLPFPGTRYPIH